MKYCYFMTKYTEKKKETDLEQKPVLVSGPRAARLRSCECCVPLYTNTEWQFEKFVSKKGYCMFV